MTHPALAEHATYLDALTPESAGMPEAHDLVMRVSTVGSADLCPGRVWLRSRPGYRDEPGEQLVFGTLVHHLVESTILTGHAPTPSEAVAEAEVTLIDEGCDPAWAGDLGQWAGEALRLAVAWQYWARQNLGWPLPELRHVEQPLAATIGYRGDDAGYLWLAGTPDLLLPERRLGLDWKTSAKGWPATRAAGQNQHHAYHWLASQVLDEQYDEWWFVVADRRRGTWTHYPATPSAVGADGFLYRAQALAHALEADAPTYHTKGEGGRRAWWCTPTYCPAWGLCPAHYLGDDQDTRPAVVADWPTLTVIDGK